MLAPYQRLIFLSKVGFMRRATGLFIAEGYITYTCVCMQRVTHILMQQYIMLI